MISHGASRFTKDRIYYASDKFEVYSCKKCGMFAVFNKKNKYIYVKHATIEQVLIEFYYHMRVNCSFRN